ANSAADVVQRLEAMVLIGAPHWPAEVVRRQIRSAIDLVAYLRRTGGRRRRACERLELCRLRRSGGRRGGRGGRTSGGTGAGLGRGAAPRIVARRAGATPGIPPVASGALVHRRSAHGRRHAG